MSKQRTKKPAKRAAKVPDVPIGQTWVFNETAQPRGRLFFVWTGTVIVSGFGDGSEWVLTPIWTPKSLDASSGIRRVKGTS